MAAPLPEPLSVSTAIIGLLAVGGRLMERIWDLSLPSAAAASAPVLVQALQAVKQCRATVHVLYKAFSLLEAAQLPLPQRSSWIDVDHLVATLADTVLALSDLELVCHALDEQRRQGQQRQQHPHEQQMQQQMQPSLHHQHQLQPVLSSPACSLYETIGALCSRIRWHNLSMTIMVTILKCPGESDARTAKIGLDRRMVRLLTSNTALSGRMRFDGDTDVLPHYTPSVPPASRPVPAPASPSGSVKAGSEAPRLRRPALSPFSGYTLADIPVLSMIPLPVTIGELCDGQEFYTPSYARRVGRDLGELMQRQAAEGISSSTLGFILATRSSSASTSSTEGIDERSATADPPAAAKPSFRKVRVKKPWRAR